MTRGMMSMRQGRIRTKLLLLFSGLLAVAAAGGCGSGPDLEVLVIQPHQYQAAFHAALEAAHDERLDPIVRDIRTGVIETEPTVAASLLEPWRVEPTGLDQRFENTIAMRRRFARFEFSPAGSTGRSARSPLAEARADGADPLGLGAPLPDLTAAEGPIELRIWVFLEQATRPGLRRGTWTRRSTTQAAVYRPGLDADIDEEPLPRLVWTPVSRDPAMETHLLNEVRKSLSRTTEREAEMAAATAEDEVN
jgi:hypothetical protein